MLQLYPVYLLWNRHKTLTGSPDPTDANGTNKPYIITEILQTKAPQNNHNMQAENLKEDPVFQVMLISLPAFCSEGLLPDNCSFKK